MGVSINDPVMNCENTPHAARLVPGDDRQWEVSWLPGRRLNRNEAITAMVLTDAAGLTDARHRARMRPFIEGWAEELGLTADQALTWISAHPAWILTAETAPEQADPEASE